MAQEFTIKHKPSLWYWSPISYLAFLVMAPYYIFRLFTTQKYREGLRQRLTLYTSTERERFREGRFIWVHTVSVGELQAVRPLLRELKKQYPTHRIFITTVTLTGQNLAKTVENVDCCLYLPLDLYPLCQRMLRVVKPERLIIMETELWPNLIRAASDWNLPIHLVNARLSDKSFRNYRLFRCLFKPLLGHLHGILAQSETDASRFLELGADSDKVFAVGNMKFEAIPDTSDISQRSFWRNLFQIGEDEIGLLGGSTFSGEEIILANILQVLRKEDLPFRLIIAPRHIERANTIIEELNQKGVATVRRSTLSDTRTAIDPSAVLLLDTIGELRTVYAAADIVFIGKSLCEKGGQNPIEPAAWAKPVLFGPNMQNFRDIASLFIQSSGALMVDNEKILLDECRRFCLSPEQRIKTGENAKNVVENNNGVLPRIMEKLRLSLQDEAV